jgi:ribosome-binding factor A
MLHSRIKRVEELYQRELAQIMAYEMSDPRIKMVTATRVTISKDLRDATIFISVLSDDLEEQEQTVAALNAAKGYIKRVLASRIVLKRLPDPYFKLDHSVEKAFQLFKVMSQIQEEDAAKGEDGPPGESESEE